MYQSFAAQYICIGWESNGLDKELIKIKVCEYICYEFCLKVLFLTLLKRELATKCLLLRLHK